MPVYYTKYLVLLALKLYYKTKKHIYFYYFYFYLIFHERYAVKLDGYTPSILKNRIDKANANIVLADKDNKLSREQKLTLILWARKIDISQVAKNILQGGMVDDECVIKPVQH